MKFRSIAVIGPGLLGGSLLMALSRLPDPPSLRVWARRRQSLDQVSSRLSVEIASTDIGPVVSGADLVVICSPVETMGDLAEKMASHLDPGTLVTDVGSVKMPLVDAIGSRMPDHAEFIGSHPMAGSEKSGFEAATASLFEGSCCIVTPTADTDSVQTEGLVSFWKEIGCTVHTMDPHEHDRAVAAVSHLPHAIAAVLVHHLATSQPKALELAGNGFMDTTRIAAGAPGLWRHILENNADNVRAVLDGYIASLQSLGNMVAENRWDDVEDLLGNAKTTREKMN